MEASRRERHDHGGGEMNENSAQYRRIEEIKNDLKTFRQAEVERFEERMRLETLAKRVAMSNAVKDAVAAGMSKNLARQASGRTSSIAFRELLDLTPDWRGSIPGEIAATGPVDYGLNLITYVREGDDMVARFSWNQDDNLFAVYVDDHPEDETAQNFNPDRQALMFANEPHYWDHPDRDRIVRQMLEIVEAQK